MSKIKKDLSDQDMLKNWHEKETFETAFLRDEESGKLVGGVRKKAEKEESFLPEEVNQKLEKLVLDVRLEFFKQGTKELKWKVTRTAEGILLTPHAK